MKNIAIWTEGGSNVGMGHICRCLIIAKALYQAGAQVNFLVNDDSVVIDRIKKSKFPFKIFSIDKKNKDFDALNLFDTVLIDTKKDVSEIIKTLKEFQHNVVLLDNTTPARLLADTVVYPTAIFENSLDWNKYKGQVFGGGEYVPIAESYEKARKISEEIDFSPPYQIMVTMGGTDYNKLTYKVLSSLIDLPDDFVKIKIIIGPGFDFDNRLVKFEKYSHVDFIRNLNDLSEVMATSHVGITALGTTIYEFALVGVPSIIIANYESDKKDMEFYEKWGMNTPLGFYKSVTSDYIKGGVEKIINNKNLWVKFREKGWSTVDGRGSDRIARLILNS